VTGGRLSRDPPSLDRAEESAIASRRAWSGSRDDRHGWQTVSVGIGIGIRIVVAVSRFAGRRELQAECDVGRCSTRVPWRHRA
jgi:hypothetical protein